MSENIPGNPQLVVFVSLILLLTSCGGSGGSDAPPNAAADWLIPISEVIDGGPGKDGIPAIDSPLYESATTISRSAIVR